ncbi:MAG: DNA topoisomerase IV subunit A [Phycisphaerae bacterium]|nr:DNA topoisomerase IV subunit A [Phycisphaerae bacterium]
MPRTARSSTRPAVAGKIEKLVSEIVERAGKRKEPALDVPMRTLSNARYNKVKRIIEMGRATQNREFFKLGTAKSFMQTLLVASGCKRLIDEGKTASIRQVYYLLKHSIPGTREKTFNDQSESDPILEDLEVTIDALREELHVFADSKGAMVGEIILTDAGDTIDCTRLGTGGYAIPSIVEPEIIRFKKCNAKFVLHVEKGTVWRRFVEDRFWKSHRCIVTHGGGQPPRGVRRLLYRLHHELNLPVYVLLDNDPWGYYIYSVIKQGSINLAFESRRMAVPDAKFIGVRSGDFEKFHLSDDVKIAIDDKDIKRAKQILAYPWFEGKKEWKKEIDLMLRHGFKMEVESMMTKSISFVTESYVPHKLKHRDEWLD